MRTNVGVKILSLSLLVGGTNLNSLGQPPPCPETATEKQVTRGPGGRILTNTGVWSPDGQWIVYDTRSDPAGDKFDGDRIEMVRIDTGEVKVLYQSTRGAHCGVVTFHPTEPKVVFILGPENPGSDWQYGPAHRRGVIVDVRRPGELTNLDARDLTPPFTPGALRGGSHVHVWDAPGQWVSFTYEDSVLSRFTGESPEHQVNLRNLGVCVPDRAVHVKPDHPRNHNGSHFSVLVTRTVANPKPGSDEIKRAFEEAWIGTNGYVRPDATRQKHALAFQGHVVTRQQTTISEAFLVDLSEDLTVPGNTGPLEGSSTLRPQPPRGTTQRRLTFTSERKFPGIQGPRHWLRSSPDGSRIAFLMKDDAGVVQLWTVRPAGGASQQLTRNQSSVASAFSWSPDGREIAHIMDNSVCVSDAQTGATRRLTDRVPDATAPRPEACVFSPDGRRIAYIRRIPAEPGAWNQIFVCEPR